MLKPVRSSHFKKDIKKAKKQGKDLELLKNIIEKLAADAEKPLKEKYRDHQLIGDWKGYREYHLKPDWLLIYKIEGPELRLARLGSHSELFS